MFINNRVNYNLVYNNNFVEEMKHNMFRIFSKYNNISNIKYYYNKSARTPYAYILPKNKDVNRDRPVVSYYFHPYKKLLNICARGIMHMLKNVDDDNCILWKTHDILDVCNEKVNRLVDMHSDRISNADICVRAYDIKNFYTNLSHSEIRAAYKWLVSSVRSSNRRCKYIYVPRDRNELCRYDNRAGRFCNDFYCLDLDLIYEVINVDLDNAVFNVGDISLKQTKGIPMGSPLSPVLSILVAAYYESRFFRSCSLDDRSRIEGIRYVDDIIALGIYDSDCRSDRMRTKLVMDQFENHCYHDDLVLEKETVVDNSCIFLEADMKIHVDYVEMKHKNVNWSSLVSYSRQKIRRYVHWYSHTSGKHKRAVIIGTMKRIAVHSSSVNFIMESMMKLFFELRVLEYPWNFIRKVIDRLCNSNAFPWMKIKNVCSLLVDVCKRYEWSFVSK